jgi:hypothetical protein
MNNNANGKSDNEENGQSVIIEYFSKIDTSTRDFYIKTILKIYYLLHEIE